MPIFSSGNVSVSGTPTVSVTELANRTTLKHAQVDIPTAGTRVQLASQAVPNGFKVAVKGHPSNGAALIYVGDSTVSSTNGFILAAGDVVALQVTNSNVIYVDTNTNGADVCWIVET